MNFAEQSVWDEGYAQHEFFVAPKEDALRQWLEAHFVRGNKSCLELGCFPGRYLAVFGELGYELNGLDLTPRVEQDLPAWLRRMNYRLGEIHRGDVFTYKMPRRYDVVCSFGLIEHFSNWAELLRRHAQYVAPSGMLAVATPNFRGWFQQGFHRLVDRVNFDRHNLDAMQPEQWAREIRPLGFEVRKCGFLGPFDAWAGEQKRNLLQRAVLKAVRKGIPLMRLLPERCGAYAPYCILLAERTGTGTELRT